MFNRILNVVKTAAFVGSAVAAGVAIAVVAPKSYRDRCLANAKQQPQPADPVEREVEARPIDAVLLDPWTLPLDEDEATLKGDRVPPMQWATVPLMLPPAKVAKKNYKSMTLKELKDEAKEKKIKNFNGLKKAELIKRLAALSAA